MVVGSVDLAPGEIEGTRGEYVLAHNGWVMNADPLVNFAAEGSQVSPPYVCVCVCVCVQLYNTVIALIIVCVCVCASFLVILIQGCNTETAFIKLHSDYIFPCVCVCVGVFQA